MVNIIQDVAGVDFMTEKDIVMEMILTGKNVLNRYAIAIGETTTPQVRDTLKNHINQIIDTVGQITDYAVAKGYYHPFNTLEQFKDDLKEAYLALDLEPWKMQGDEESFGLKRDLPIVRS